MPGRLETEIVHNADGSIGFYGNGVEFARIDGANLKLDILSGGELEVSSGATADIGSATKTLDIVNADINASAAIARSKLAEDALSPFPIEWMNVMAEDGAVLGVAEEAGTFFRQDGTNQMYLQGEEALSETEVSVSKFTFTLPHNYVAAGDIKIRAVAVVTGAGTLGTCTLDFSAYKTDDDGAVGSDLVATAATAISATAGAKDFTVTATGLAAGDHLSIVMTASVAESAGTAIRALITKLQVLCDVKG